MKKTLFILSLFIIVMFTSCGSNNNSSSSSQTSIESSSSSIQQNSGTNEYGIGYGSETYNSSYGDLYGF